MRKRSGQPVAPALQLTDNPYTHTMLGVRVKIVGTDNQLRNAFLEANGTTPLNPPARGGRPAFSSPREDASSILTGRVGWGPACGAAA